MEKQTAARLPYADFLRRVISAVILLPFVVLAFWAGGLWLALLVAIFAPLMAFEWAQLMAAKNPRLTVAYLILFLLTIIALTAFADIYIGSIAMLFCLLCAFFIAPMISEYRQVLFGGLLYIGAPIFALLFLRAAENGALVIIYLALMVWATDICAMLFGKAIGGAKLMPSISPQKTWAGLIGGMIGAAGMGALYAVLMTSIWLNNDILQGVTPFFLSILGAVCALIAQAGDLFESWLKRRHNIKDSGRLLPGHGGILDRVDGLVAVLVSAALFVFLYHRFFGMDNFFNTGDFNAAILLLWAH
ncbi:MAG: phosphatidate cytidylyltransferase [Alphaproteobacteria bacterium]|nr:phosphatidate cytidylyltransferase [Alphaproteobacteria bacterium]